MANAKAGDEEVRDPLDPEVRKRHYAPSRNAFEVLLNFQRASPERLSANQESNVRALVEHAIAQVPFYRDRLAMLQGSSGIDLSRWLDVPVLTRKDVVEEKEALAALEIPQAHGKTRVARSSGTSGGRVEVLRTDLQESVDASCQFRFWHDSGIDWSKNIGIIRAIDPNSGVTGKPDPELSRWGPPWLPFSERGTRNSLSVHTPPGQQLEWLEKHGPIYLNTMPSNLLNLAHHVRDTGRKVQGIAGALTGGDTLTDDIRKEALRWLGVEARDTLATGECGRIAAQCPGGGGGYHIETEQMVVEVLKEDGTPCGPGKTGLLTLTPLYSFAMPLIRYRLQDWVTVGAPCGCGRTSPVIAEIIGRDSTLLRFKDGVRIRLEPDSETIHGLIGPRRFQIAQTAHDKIEIRIAEMRTEQPADTDAMIAYVKGLVGRDIDVTSHYVPVLGTAPSGKFDRVRRYFD